MRGNRTLTKDLVVRLIPVKLVELISEAKKNLGIKNASAEAVALVYKELFDHYGIEFKEYGWGWCTDNERTFTRADLEKDFTPLGYKTVIRCFEFLDKAGAITLRKEGPRKAMKYIIHIDDDHDFARVVTDSDCRVYRSDVAKELQDHSKRLGKKIDVMNAAMVLNQLVYLAKTETEKGKLLLKNLTFTYEQVQRFFPWITKNTIGIYLRFFRKAGIFSVIKKKIGKFKYLLTYKFISCRGSYRKVVAKATKLLKGLTRAWDAIKQEVRGEAMSWGKLVKVPAADGGVEEVLDYGEFWAEVDN